MAFTTGKLITEGTIPAGSIGTTELADGSATNAKLADMAQATFKMRASGAGTGDPIDGTATQAKTALAIANTDVSGLGALATLSSVDTTEITNGAVTQVKLATDAVATIKIQASAVTDAKLANMGANTVKGNPTNASAAPTGISLAASQLLGRGSSGDISAITLGAGLSIATAVLNNGAGTAHGSAVTALAFATTNVCSQTPNSTRTYTTTVPPFGTPCTLIVNTSGTTSYTLTFGTGFKTTGTLATGTVTAKTFTVSFISDGTSVIETARTVAM